MITVPRRIEFQETRWETAQDILSQARYGHVAAVGPDGLPQVWPLNYVLREGALYFHGSPRSGLSRCVGRPVVFTAEDSVAWIPSSWRAPGGTSSATTFYRSVQVHGTLESPPEQDRAGLLEAFMARYQPEGGYPSLSHPEQEGSFGAVAVTRLPIGEWTCRVKMGQNLPDDQRRLVHDRLLRRGERGDREAAARMRQANLGLAETGPWTDDPSRVPLDQLHAMLNRTYWAEGRPLHRVSQHLWEADLTMARVEGGRLLAYARVVGCGRSVAWLFDVVVVEDQRGRGMGCELIRRLLGHPRMEAVHRLFLSTRDAEDFYSRFGFQVLKTGRQSLMLREVPLGAVAAPGQAGSIGHGPAELEDSTP